MLQAKAENGQLIVPAQLTKSELEHIRHKNFYCPVCKNKVILKAGPQIIPHFAHYAKSRCPSSKRGESIYHQQGKLLLYDWLKQQHFFVQLEPFIHSIQQQPDILLSVGQQKIAIEFQNSRIPFEQIQNRNNGYRKLNIEPIWILGEKLLKRRMNRLISVDSFTKQFIHQFSVQFPLTLFYFCPSTKIFTQVQHIYLFTQSLAFAQIKQNPLSQLTLRDVFKEQLFSKKDFFNHLYRRKRNFRIYPLKPYGHTRKWFEWLYKKRTHIQYLPPYVYLPIRSQLYMKTPLWDWQSRLCIDVLEHIPINGKIELPMIKRRFDDMKEPSNHFPLIKHLQDPIVAYMNLLASFNVIKQIDEKTYVKLRHIPFPNHIEQAIVIDRKLLAKWYKSYSLTYETSFN